LNKNCAPTGTPNNNLCGDPDAPADGYCEETSSLGVYRCTVPCGGDDDCKVGFACNASTTPDTCSL